MRRTLLVVCLSLTCLLACSRPPAPETAPAAPTPIDAIIAHAQPDTFARDALRELCDEVGPRLAGSEGMRRAHAWAERRLAEAGADSVWLEPVTVSRWQRGVEWARLTAPYDAPLTMLGLGFSDGTGPDGIEAEVLVVRDWDEFEARSAEAAGKIVLFDPPWEGYGPNVRYRVKAASTAARFGAVAALVRPAGFGQNTPHTGIMHYDDDAPRIPVASLSVEGAALLHRLADAGLTPRVRLMMNAEPLSDGPCANVVAELRGREIPEEVVLIAGHLDAWDAGSGAHDDGAGCVIMVAAMKTLADLDLRPRRTVRVVLYTGEEIGGHGGRAYAERHAAEIPNTVLALESDSGGFAPAGFTVRADSTVVEALAPYAAPLAVLGADEVKHGGAGADIGPLVERGVVGLGHRVHGEEYFRYHHSPADVFPAVDPVDLAANVAVVAALVFNLADAPTPLPRNENVEAP